MLLWIGVLLAWVLVALPLAVGVGRGLRLADLRSGVPAGPDVPGVPGGAAPPAHGRPVAAAVAPGSP